ncbi:ABA4-like family protein [Sphingorhabdus arenilitoris]|uniref:ABA4-like family protein n=1 Tax=Sphingorhabdus arenilitoris TaxID=1490041 RepID=A0ABV8REI7_9SPHN
MGIELPWETIFKVANVGILPFWLLLAFGPRRQMVLRGIFLLGSGLLAVSYAILIVGLLGGAFDGGGGAGGNADLTTLAGAMALFDSPGGATIGWIHYLAFDLFVGIWIARNADRHAIARLWQIPCLFLTLMFGPIGLLLYLILRSFLGKSLENGFTPR